MASERQFSVSFPIRIDETHELAFGLFCAHVALIYHQLLEADDLQDTPAPEVKHRLIAGAIRETVRWFPLSIRERLEEAADRLAAELIGGSQLFAAT